MFWVHCLGSASVSVLHRWRKQARAEEALSPAYLRMMNHSLCQPLLPSFVLWPHSLLFPTWYIRSLSTCCFLCLEYFSCSSSQVWLLITGFQFDRDPRGPPWSLHPQSSNLESLSTNYLALFSVMTEILHMKLPFMFIVHLPTLPVSSKTLSCHCWSPRVQNNPGTWKGPICWASCLSEWKTLTF